VIALALLALLVAQLHAFLVGWTGSWLPDPVAVLAAFVGLSWPRASLLGAVLVLGWTRALVLAEPVGGHVLALAVAVFLLASQRDSLDGRRAGTLLFGTFVAALALAAAGGVLRWVSGAPLTAGWAVLAGALLALPLAPAARAATRRLKRVPA
jgi:hypothetical protein